MHISLHDILLTGFDIYALKIPGQVYPFALASSCWLDYKRLRLLLVELILEVVVFVG